MTVQAATYQAASRRRPREAFGRRLQASPYPWLVPVSIVLALFYLYPLIDVFRFAFTNASLLGRDEHYTLASIEGILGNPDLPVIFQATFVFTAGSVVGQQLFGLLIAMLLVRSEQRGLWGVTALRAIILVAWVVPGIANGIIWQLLFSEAPFGAINSLLRQFGIAPVAWLSDPTNAMWSAIISNVWRGTAFSMIVLYAALKSIDPTYYEAAEVDGAGSWQKFRYITLPQMRTALLVNSILITIQTINTFDAIISLTGGGPGRATEVLSLFAFNTVFRNYDLAGGSVLSVIMLIISLGLALFYAFFLPRRERAE